MVRSTGKITGVVDNAETWNFAELIQVCSKVFHGQLHVCWNIELSMKILQKFVIVRAECCGKLTIDVSRTQQLCSNAGANEQDVRNQVFSVQTCETKHQSTT